MSSPKEAEVEEKQRGTQPTRNEGWTSSKPKEGLRPVARYGVIREGHHRRHRFPPFEEKKKKKKRWRYGFRLLRTRSLKEGAM
jgi:ribosomal protein S21